MATKHVTRNVGNLDRGLRAFVIAPVAIVAAILAGASSIGGIALFALAGIMLASSAAGFCALYTLVRIHTRSRTPLPH